jgi:hypothetical protein
MGKFAVQARPAGKLTAILAQVRRSAQPVQSIDPQGIRPMTKFAQAARTVTLTTALILIGGMAYLWAQALTEKADFFGPSCAAQFSC